MKLKEYWGIVDSGILELTKGVLLKNTQRIEREGLHLKDLKAKNFLFQAIDRLILETILCKYTSKHIWDSMKKKYQGSTKVRRA